MPVWSEGRKGLEESTTGFSPAARNASTLFGSPSQAQILASDMSAGERWGLSQKRGIAPILLHWMATRPRFSRAASIRGRTFSKAHSICAASSKRNGTDVAGGAGRTSCMPTLEMAAAWSWPIPILRTMSPSLPCAPPAYTRSFTCPPEACSQRWPMSRRSSCQVDPCGARVPSFSVTTPWARAEEASAASRAARTILFTFHSRLEEELLHVVQQRAGAPLRDDVGEPEPRLRPRVGPEHLLEHARELGPVLLLDEHALRP